MLAVRAVAKPTHPAYGASRAAAVGSTRRARRARSSVDASRTRISSSAQRGFRAVKNTQVQPVFSTRLAPSAVPNAVRSSGPARSSTRAEETATSA